ncbi:MAG: ABC transporter ATP-binding protein [Tissierellia bacterium]|nr:ABC transporter ATP-binding protein [Tissierellia bacterium]
MYKIEKISKSYGELKVLDNISLEFPEEKTTCILGPSGCGKTSLLNILADLTAKDSGEIIGFEDEKSYIFQEDRLIPWKSVKENLELVLKGEMDKNKALETIDKYLELVNLEEYKHYYPKELSGGMRQRINILRAFIYPAKLIIMDEPFKSLDINQKKILMDFFINLREKDRKTCIMVTHDIDEAIALGHRIVIFTEKPTRVKRIMDIENYKDKAKLRGEISKEFKKWDDSHPIKYRYLRIF